MHIIESTQVWKRTLGREHSEQLPNFERNFVERLVSSFSSFRRQVSVVVAEIPRCFRDLTVHDMDHIDALWQCADTLVDDTFALNPAEAYVLGGAFLLHDAGLALASYADGQDEIEQTIFWRDAAAFQFKKTHGRAIADRDWETLDESFKQGVNEHFLRLRHAEQAASLYKTEFKVDSGLAPVFLIEDRELREAFGHSIGIVAHSHWWPVSEVVDRLDKSLGSFPGGPSGWTVDLLKIAFLLRTADSIQIDSRRAPALLRALRKPRGIAERHWQFQELLNQPYAQNGSVYFTSKMPFDLEKSDAWWTGVELAELADRELRDAEMLLSEKGRPLFQAHRVAGLDGRGGVSRHIETEGWIPVTSKIHVSDVASLVTTLGGEGLYGEKPHVALRELIQNARDAVVARRLLEDRANDWGEIEVSLATDHDHTYLRVRDFGVGMSPEVMSGALLDFGRSYWATEQMLSDHPKLASAGFEPNGKYGIGFFSVFMVADTVRVISRSANGGTSDTIVLEFADGVTGRCLLRDASESERLMEPGTLVELTLKKDPSEKGGLLAPMHVWSRTLAINTSHKRETDWTLDELCQWLAPALDVNLTSIQHEESRSSIRANDWTSIAADKLVSRLLMFRDADDRQQIVEGENAKRIFENIEMLFDEFGSPIGRAAIVDWTAFNPEEEQGKHYMSAPSVVTAGQFRSRESLHFCGIFLGRPIRATRASSEPLICLELLSLAKWATSQSRKVERLVVSDHERTSAGGLIRLLGGNSGDLQVFRTFEGFQSFNDIVKREWPSVVELVPDFRDTQPNIPLELKDHQIAISPPKMKKLHEWSQNKDPLNRAQHEVWDRFWMAHWGAAIEAVAISWGAELNAVLNAAEFSPTKKEEPDGSITHVMSPDVLYKPT